MCDTKQNPKPAIHPRLNPWVGCARGAASVPDLRSVLARFLGPAAAEQAATVQVEDQIA